MSSLEVFGEQYHLVPGLQVQLFEVIGQVMNLNAVYPQIHLETLEDGLPFQWRLWQGGPLRANSPEELLIQHWYSWSGPAEPQALLTVAWEGLRQVGPVWCRQYRDLLIPNPCFYKEPLFRRSGTGWLAEGYCLGQPPWYSVLGSDPLAARRLWWDSAIDKSQLTLNTALERLEFEVQAVRRARSNYTALQEASSAYRVPA